MTRVSGLSRLPVPPASTTPFIQSPIWRLSAKHPSGKRIATCQELSRGQSAQMICPGWMAGSAITIESHGLLLGKTLVKRGISFHAGTVSEGHIRDDRIGSGSN